MFVDANEIANKSAIDIYKLVDINNHDIITIDNFVHINKHFSFFFSTQANALKMTVSLLQHSIS